jgi:hypothetical protein
METLVPTNADTYKQEVLPKRELYTKAIPNGHNRSALQNLGIPSSHFVDKRY